MNAAWSSINTAFQEFLADRAGLGCLPQRVFAASAWRPPFPEAAGECGEALTKELAAVVLCRRRWAGLVREIRRGSAKSVQAEALWRALSPDAYAAVPGVEQALAALDAVQAREKDVAGRLRAARRDGWHQWVTSALNGGGGRIYRWLRAEVPVFPLLVPGPTHSVGAAGIAALQGGPAAELRHAEGLWKEMWCAPTLGPGMERTPAVPGPNGLDRRTGCRSASANGPGQSARP